MYRVAIFLLFATMAALGQTNSQEVNPASAEAQLAAAGASVGSTASSLPTGQVVVMGSYARLTPRTGEPLLETPSVHLGSALTPTIVEMQGKVMAQGGTAPAIPAAESLRGRATGAETVAETVVDSQGRPVFDLGAAQLTTSVYDIEGHAQPATRLGEIARQYRENGPKATKVYTNEDIERINAKLRHTLETMNDAVVLGEGSVSTASGEPVAVLPGKPGATVPQLPEADTTALPEGRE